jgi:hypothetical protein
MLHIIIIADEYTYLKVHGKYILILLQYTVCFLVPFVEGEKSDTASTVSKRQNIE